MSEVESQLEDMTIEERILWSLKHPPLYEVTIQKKRDGASERFVGGLRYHKAQVVLNQLRLQVLEDKIWDCGLRLDRTQKPEEVV